MPSEHHPQAALELRACARHLLQRPLFCKERDPEIFRLIRRHEADLDRWFTQRLGYRLHVDADTARLFKTGFVPARRPLRVRSERAFHQLEYVLLALVLAATAAGPPVISLRDLIERVRSAGVEADVRLDESPATRRALVAVLQWMILQGLAAEMHAGVDAYAQDETADAVLKLRPDRIALLAQPGLAGAESGEELLQRGERRSGLRQWMRCRLVEDPVLYREDLAEAEWFELRRRLGEEERLLEEMFGLLLEARAEGVAAIDPTGSLAERRFPATGTLAHAALLLLDARRGDAGTPVTWEEVVHRIEALAKEHRRRWAGSLVEAPSLLARQVVELLFDLRLAEPVMPSPTGSTADDPHRRRPVGSTEPVAIRLLPAAGRFLPVDPQTGAGGDVEENAQAALW